MLQSFTVINHSLSFLQAVGIIERDKNTDVRWTWSYPMFSDGRKEFVLNKCCLSWHSDEKKHVELVPFVYSRQLNLWFYIFTSSVGEETKLHDTTHFSIVITAKDFNPEKYAVLSRIMSEEYDETGSSSFLLAQYLQVAMQGRCQTESRRLFRIDYFTQKKAFSAASLKDVVNNFGVESILLYLAVLLKKRIFVKHQNVDLLLEFIRALPCLAWHRQDWSILYPWVDDFEAIVGLPCYIAGTCKSEVQLEEEKFDLFVDVPLQTISVSDHAKESLTVGRLHKDITRILVELSQDDATTNEELIEIIHQKTEEILSKLRSLGNADESTVSIEQIKSRRFNQTTGNFLVNLAAAEKILKV